MKRITVRVPERDVDGIEALVEADEYVNQSDAVRDAIRRLVSTRRCPSCGATGDDVVPVWEGDTADGPPDYIGCVSCDAEMTPYKQ